MFLWKREYALQLPNNYVEIDRDEMEYVDGGYRSSRSVYVPSGSKRMSKQSYMNTQYVNSVLAGIVIGIATGGIGVILHVSVGTSFALGAAGTILGALGGSGFSVAEKLDRADGSYDGMLTVSWNGFWKTEYNPYPPNSYEGAMF